MDDITQALLAQAEDEAIMKLAEQGGDSDLEYLAYEDYLVVRS